MKMLTVQDIAEELQISVSSARTLMSRMNRTNIGRGNRPVWRVSRQAFENWLASRQEHKHIAPPTYGADMTIPRRGKANGTTC